MRELDFIPDWYPKHRRRKRLVAMQLWATFLLILGLGAWMLAVERNVRSAEVSLDSLNGQLAQTANDLRQLREQTEYKTKLRLQEQIVARLGFPVEMTRVLHTLDALMPREMSLSELTFDTEESARPVQAASGRGPKTTVTDRRMKVKMVGITPNDTDVATVIQGLGKHGFLQQVSFSYIKDRVDGGHLMREFEINFVIDLNVTLSPAGGGTTSDTTYANVAQ